MAVFNVLGKHAKTWAGVAIDKEQMTATIVASLHHSCEKERGHKG